MSINLQETFHRGGREMIAVLEHCVLSVNMDALFVYLTREYRLRPTAVAALALHDLFCAAEAPARISALAMIPPKDLRIERALVGFRETASHAEAEDEEEESESENGPVFIFPPNYLFDPIVQVLTGESGEAIKRLESRYNLERTPRENLPGGKLSQGQRAFVDFVWTPRVKPLLVQAGFWRMSTIC